MSEWVSVGWKDVSTEEPKRKDRGHSFTKIAKVTWPSFCSHCGHVPLKNKVSVLVSRIGCDFERDARFQSWRRNPGSVS